MVSRPMLVTDEFTRRQVTILSVHLQNTIDRLCLLNERQNLKETCSVNYLVDGILHTLWIFLLNIIGNVWRSTAKLTESSHVSKACVHFINLT